MNSRQEQIIDIVNKNGSTTVKDLKELFGDVSEMTLRRDLEFLDKENKIIRVHGGAKSLNAIVNNDLLYPKRATDNVESKKLIAQKALKFISPNCTIYLDSGSTISEFAKILPDIPMFIFTGNLVAALDLTRCVNAQVSMFGGRVNTQSYCVSGYNAPNYLRDVYFSYAFFGTTGYSDECGFTCGHESEYNLKKMMIEKSDKNIVLMDSSKVGKNSTFRFASLEDIDIVISDGKLPKKTIEQFEKNGITVL